ncbi:hypothetical protein KLP40_19410 [Hymenobacter sp. NST-14]|uniref:hypothetical protein n=1 Tax=Hymenobacter piscis TaxID=2839984 RepID=UPI001C018A39|nr:hypothetical protein [Hymenobacter piscis]MBT9395344.1 hypothetical protein [Hymenobacter piscis]
MKALSATDQANLDAFIINASKGKIEIIAPSLKSNFSHRNFIDSSNPLSHDPMATAEDHVSKKSAFNLTEDQLSSYLAASTLLDCFDAWSYLSAATSQLLAGNRSLSVHLAYYAELRATKSILASEGIGSFSKHNLSVTSTAGIGYFEKATHTFLWHALESWIKNPKGAMNLLDSFSFYGRTFTDWMSSTGRVTPLEAQKLVRSWLRTWSMDLKVFGHDHESRNSVSYQSGSMKNFALPLDFAPTLDFISSSWESVLPSAVDAFSIIDKYLLRLLFKELRNYLKVIHKGSSIPSIKELVTTASENIGGVPENIYRFLYSKNADLANLPVLDEAAKSVDVPFLYSSSPLPVISRALLMLRISTGVAINLLKSATISASDLSFWTHTICNDLGYVNGPLPGSLRELDSDILYTLEYIKEWVENNIGNITLNKFNVDMPNEARILSQLQRVGLWNLA